MHLHPQSYVSSTKLLILVIYKYILKALATFVLLHLLFLIIQH